MNTDISTLMGGEGWLPKLKMPIPGIVLCTAITVAAFLVEHAEVALAGRAWVEALVLAILIGTAIRAVWAPPARVENRDRFQCQIPAGNRGCIAGRIVEHADDRGGRSGVDDWHRCNHCRFHCSQPCDRDRSQTAASNGYPDCVWELDLRQLRYRSRRSDHRGG